MKINIPIWVYIPLCILAGYGAGTLLTMLI